MNIGEAIRRLRRSQGLTQGQLAEKCLTTTNAVSRWETGLAYPPKGTVECICRALGVPTSYLLLASIEAEDVPEEKRMLYTALLEPLRRELLTNKES